MDSKEQSANSEIKEIIHLLDYLKTVRKRWKSTLFVFLTIAILGAFITSNQPKTYTASASLKVNPEYEQAALDVFQQRYYRDRFWLQTEFELIKSDRTLEKVVKELKINDLNLFDYYKQKHQPTLFSNICQSLKIDPAKINKMLSFFKSKDKEKKPVKLDKEEIEQIRLKGIIGRLKGMISTKAERDTTIIRIYVTSVEAPEEAQKIANAVVKAYGDNRVQGKLDLITRGLKVLEKQISDQEDIVKSEKNKVSSIREKYKLPYLQNQPLTQGNIQEVERLKTELAQARVEMAIHNETLVKINKMTKPELEEALGVIIPDSQDYLKLKNELNQSILEFKLLQIDLGDKHPKVKRGQKKMEELRKQMDERLAGIKSGFRLQYEKAKARVDQMQAELQKMLAAYSGVNALQIQEFNDAVNNLKVAEQHLAELKDRLMKEKINIQIPRSGVTVTGEAVRPLLPSSPNVLRNFAITLFVAMIMSIGVIFFLEYLDTSIKNIEELEQMTGLQVLSIIPKKVPVFFTEETPSKYHEETYRILYTNLSFARTDNHLNCNIVAFTSSGESEGKSTTTANLAYIASKAGQKVLIIDADLHRPVQHNLSIDGTESKGLVDLLTGNAEIDEAIMPSTHDNLFHIYAGVNFNRFAGLINPAMLTNIFQQLRKKFDLILIDCPPILGVNDSALIASVSDYTVMVVKDHGYPSKMIKRAVQTLHSSGANIAGTVLNDSQTPDYYYSPNYYTEKNK